MINEITIRGALPDVFSGMESMAPVCNSQVWLSDVTFRRPDYYMVEAESGTGKSSLCSFIYGSRGDYRGSICFDGRDVKTFTTEEWCKLRTHALAYLPQEMHLFPELTVRENIMVKNRLTHCRSEQWILQALKRLEIEEKIDSPAALLSVGQQQRVAIVRALCQPFDFILIDEPVSHLDARNNAIVAQLIDEEARANTASVIATSVGNKIQLSFQSTLML
ncbi:MAG: ATP-binding cassette domain-containing protein [Firmicutes bacterium]|nr:ATP-binding cassette domain-containing protein [Bacillota bacterium]MCM1400401.1 ATP-binding cassette domain-containing protein [Bacteroides sp.]MCM1477158.1 ATP-binding cassette domain-containing protein [Bacteroides sp.]